jgi:hypothetical protein
MAEPELLVPIGGDLLRRGRCRDEYEREDAGDQTKSRHGSSLVDLEEPNS